MLLSQAAAKDADAGRVQEALDVLADASAKGAILDAVVQEAGKQALAALAAASADGQVPAVMPEAPAEEVGEEPGLEVEAPEKPLEPEPAKPAEEVAEEPDIDAAGQEALTEPRPERPAELPDEALQEEPEDMKPTVGESTVEDEAGELIGGDAAATGTVDDLAGGDSLWEAAPSDEQPFDMDDLVKSPRDQQLVPQEDVPTEELPHLSDVHSYTELMQVSKQMVSTPEFSEPAQHVEASSKASKVSEEESVKRPSEVQSFGDVVVYMSRDMLPSPAVEEEPQSRPASAPLSAIPPVSELGGLSDVESFADAVMEMDVQILRPLSGPGTPSEGGRSVATGSYEIDEEIAEALMDGRELFGDVTVPSGAATPAQPILLEPLTPMSERPDSQATSRGGNSVEIGDFEDRVLDRLLYGSEAPEEESGDVFDHMSIGETIGETVGGAGSCYTAASWEEDVVDELAEFTGLPKGEKRPKRKPKAGGFFDLDVSSASASEAPTPRVAFDLSSISSKESAKVVSMADPSVSATPEYEGSSNHSHIAELFQFAQQGSVSPSVSAAPSDVPLHRDESIVGPSKASSSSVRFDGSHFSRAYSQSIVKSSVLSSEMPSFGSRQSSKHAPHSYTSVDAPSQATEQLDNRSQGDLSVPGTFGAATEAATSGINLSQVPSEGDPSVPGTIGAATEAASSGITLSQVSRGLHEAPEIMSHPASEVSLTPSSSGPKSTVDSHLFDVMSETSEKLTPRDAGSAVLSDPSDGPIPIGGLEFDVLSAASDSLHTVVSSTIDIEQPSVDLKPEDEKPVSARDSEYSDVSGRLAPIREELDGEGDSRRGSKRAQRAPKPEKVIVIPESVKPVLLKKGVYPDYDPVGVLGLTYGLQPQKRKPLPLPTKDKYGQKLPSPAEKAAKEAKRIARLNNHRAQSTPAIYREHQIHQTSPVMNELQELDHYQSVHHRDHFDPGIKEKRSAMQRNAWNSLAARSGPESRLQSKAPLGPGRKASPAQQQQLAASISPTAPPPLRGAAGATATPQQAQAQAQAAAAAALGMAVLDRPRVQGPRVSGSGRRAVASLKQERQQKQMRTLPPAQPQQLPQLQQQAPAGSPPSQQQQQPQPHVMSRPASMMKLRAEQPVLLPPMEPAKPTKPTKPSDHSIPFPPKKQSAHMLLKKRKRTSKDGTSLAPLPHGADLLDMLRKGVSPSVICPPI